jgi:hypothetical protein
MWVFFLGSVFIHYYLTNNRVFRNFIIFFLVIISVSSVIVLLQNLSIIPFLWSNEYKFAYAGFLSGTFGPNKIVLGISMLISLCFIVGLMYTKRFRIPKLLLYIPLASCSIALLLSGSRTSYVGLGVFLLYFLFTYTSKFIFFSIAAFAVSVVIFISSPQIVSEITDVINNRITDKITKPEDVGDENSIYDPEKLFNDLGSGRDKLHAGYVNFLLSNPEIIPFGQGFNNRSGAGNSAHNMYLSVIGELGLVGLYFYFSWLFSYFKISKNRQPGLQLAVNGLVIAMIVTLYFGEHLYVYRPLFGLLGLFMATFVVLLYPLRKNNHVSKKR